MATTSVIIVGLYRFIISFEVRFLSLGFKNYKMVNIYKPIMWNLINTP